VLDAQQRAYDGIPAPAPGPDLAMQDFLIAHYEWRHAEIPDDPPTGDADA